MDGSLTRLGRMALVVALVLMAAKVVWSHREDWVQPFFQNQPTTRPNITFDNGSVRDNAANTPVPPQAPNTKATVKNELGTLKKCTVGDTVVYTDQLCPSKTKVSAVNGGNLVVLQAPHPTKPAATAPTGAQTLRDTLDVSTPNNLKEKMMERAVNR